MRLTVALLLAAMPAAANTDTGWCLGKGGAVQTRTATYGTNGGTPLPLSATRQFCHFTSPKDGSHIDVLVGTLASPKPTLAALAYYARVKFQSGTCQGSPGSCYCSQLGGTDLFGGVNAAGGGWVLAGKGSDVLDACIFPDLSSIDSYGLFYHSAGIIRGANLAAKLRYQNPY